MADTILTPEEEQQVREAIESYEARPIEGGARQLFCQHWPTAKQLLEFLASFLPDRIAEIIRKVIAAGDMAYNSTIICPR